MLNSELERLYRKNYNELYLYSFSLCKDHYLAEDITSETFIKAYLFLDEDIEYFKYWIFKVCKNIYLDYIKCNREYSSAILENTLSTDKTPLDKIIKREDKRKLYNLVISLKNPYREVLILYYYCDFSVKDICISRELTESNVKIILYRGRKILRKKLEGGEYGL